MIPSSFMKLTLGIFIYILLSTESRYLVNWSTVMLILTGTGTLVAFHNCLPFLINKSRNFCVKSSYFPSHT